MTKTFFRRAVRRLGVGSVLCVGLLGATAHAAKPITIWNLGDSVTDGAGSAPQNTDSGGFRKNMIQTLVDQGYDPVLQGSVKTEQPARIPAIMNTSARWYHEGHNGFRTSNLNDGAASWLNNSPSNGGKPIYPQYMTVMSGTNDIGYIYGQYKDVLKKPMYTPENEKDVVVTRMGGDMRKLVTKLTTLRPDSNVMVASIIPSWFGLGFDTATTGYDKTPQNAPDQTDYLLNHYVREYNKYLKDVLVPEFQAAGKKVSFVDIYSNFVVTDAKGVLRIRDGVWADLTHPNTIGNDMNGLTIGRAINALAVPEPAGLGLVMAAGFVGLRRRARRAA